MWLFRDISCKYLVRKLSIDIFDIQLNSMQQSSVDTFTFDLVTKESDLYLQKFDLVNIKSYTSQTHYYKPLSWGLHSGLNRDNTNNNLKFNNEFEIGKTLNINDQFNFNTMLALGFDNSDIYIKPNLLLQTQLISSLKIGFTSFYKMYNENIDKNATLTGKFNGMKCAIGKCG